MKRVLITILFLIMASVPADGKTSGKNSIPKTFPPLVESIRIDTPLDFCGEKVPLDNPEVRERLEKELLISLGNRHQAILWIKRARRYMPHIQKELKKNKMPDDIRFIPVIESALRPHAGSRKGAVGFWQFMAATGRRYGLTINSGRDERRNIFPSTKAALKYLADLHSLFGSWTLSAAAYNMGEDGLGAEIRAQQTNNYYNLYLSLETQRFVFRILSAKLILSDPEKFGFFLEENDLYTPLEFDKITVECPLRIPIQLVAGASKTYFKVIKDLNPEIRGHYLSKGSHKMMIPKGASRGFQARFKKLLSKWKNNSKRHIYPVKRGDNLSSIAERFNVPLTSLLRWNRLNSRSTIHPGDRLIIFLNRSGTSKQN